MKIRTKLAALSILLSGAALSLCGALLLNATSKRNLQVSIDSAITDLNVLSSTYTNAVTNAEYRGLSDIAKRSLILYIFQQYNQTTIGATEYILTQGQDTLYNHSDISPFAYSSQMLTETLNASMRTVSYCTVSAAQGEYILVSTNVSFGDMEYTVSILRNITALSDSMRLLTIQYIGICFSAFFVLAAILLLVTHQTLKPLELLKEKVSQMVSGEYGGHISVRGNDEIASLTKDFNTMLDAVQAHIQAIKNTSEEQRLLIGALTHELKTPMTAIITNAETLERTKLSEAQRLDAISFIGRECRRLERLTQKMMRLITLIDGEDILLAVIPVHKLFETVTSTLKEICDAEHIELIMRYEDQRFCMDVDLMASVCINLFDNARKAGADQITIEAFNNCIVVADNGHGIPEKEIPFITQPFYMVDKSRSKKKGSIGLGLTLVNRIAQLHNASISIQSQLNKGTTITFQFEK